MKKIISFLLASVMLASFGVAAEETAEETALGKVRRIAATLSY